MECDLRIVIVAKCEIFNYIMDIGKDNVPTLSALAPEQDV
jgi:hypothetical protein